MASPTDRSRNNIRMGIFVSIAIAMALVIIGALTDAYDRFTTRTQPWKVTFTTMTGVPNLQPGSEVRVGGIRMGEVTGIQPMIDESGTMRRIEVQFALDHRVALYENARIFLGNPLIGADAWLDIPNVGDPQFPSDPDRAIVGTETRGMLTMLVGHELADRADHLVDRVEHMMDDVAELTAWLRTLPDDVSPIIERADAFMVDARELVRTIRHDNWPRWSGDVDTIMERVRHASDTLNRALEQGEGLMVDARSVVEENRAQINSMVENLESFSVDAREIGRRINEEMLDQMEAILVRGGDALADAQQLVRTVQQDYDGWAVNLNEVFGNANIASQQLKLLMVEARRSPWKLLYTPRPDELEHELLYEAARSFAVAAGELKAATGAAERILRHHGDRLSEDEEARRRLERILELPIDRYNLAQEQLMNVLFETRP